MMPYFSGSYSHNLDDRSRLAIPAKLRDKLGSVVWLTKGRGPCLTLLPDAVWEATAGRVLSVPSWGDESSPEADDMRLFFFGGACECEIDKQNRILIPATMREQAGIGESVVIVGAGDQIEIWDADAWAKKLAAWKEKPPAFAPRPPR